MAKKEILALEQKKILDHVSREDYLVRKYYFTEGTPLSAFYLSHRISEDLDFFSEQEIHLPSIKTFVSKIQQKLNLVKVDYIKYLGLHS